MIIYNYHIYCILTFIYLYYLEIDQGCKLKGTSPIRTIQQSLKRKWLLCANHGVKYVFVTFEKNKCKIFIKIILYLLFKLCLL